MTSTLDYNAHDLSVPPEMRPWWTVRRSLRLAFTFLVMAWFAVLVYRHQVRDWVLTDLPLDDQLIARVMGYETQGQ